MYLFEDPDAYVDAFFGETYGPPIWSLMGCGGFEPTLQSCSKSVLPNFNCTQQNTAGVLCKDSKLSCILIFISILIFI